MEDKELSIKALSNIHKTRMRNTVGIFPALFFLWLLADWATSNESSMPLWASILGIVAFPFGMFILHSYDKQLSEYFNAHCPKCGKMIERSQFIGKAIPDYCKNCGLPINAFNK